MKGFTATAKRFKLGTAKLSIDFLSMRGGPVGVNHHMFIDEIVFLYKKKDSTNWS
jgi:hypothetical protein